LPSPLEQPLLAHEFEVLVPTDPFPCPVPLLPPVVLAQLLLPHVPEHPVLHVLLHPVVHAAPVLHAL